MPRDKASRHRGNAGSVRAQWKKAEREAEREGGRGRERVREMEGWRDGGTKGMRDRGEGGVMKTPPPKLPEP